MTDDEIALWLITKGTMEDKPIMALAADRILTLRAERDETDNARLKAKCEALGQEVNMAKYGQPDFAWSIHKAAMTNLQADNARLEASLWDILACETPNANATVTRMASIAKAVLKGIQRPSKAQP